MRNRLPLFFLILVSFLPACLYAQAWSGTLAPARAVDWSGAGVVGGIPSGSWPNCTSGQAGTTVPIAAYSGSGSNINTALANCASANPTGSVLQLAAGTFNLTSGIDLSGLSHIALRGQGANQTFMIFSGGASCGGHGAFVCVSAVNSAPQYEGNVCDWTAGYSAGTTVISIANCGSTKPAVGSLSNLRIGGIITLDEVDPITDTGTIWHCVNSTCANEGDGGIVRTTGPCSAAYGANPCDRSHQQVVQITNCTNIGGVCTSGTNITISPGLYEPYSSSNLPQAWYPTSSVISKYAGVENFSIAPISTCDSTGQNAGTGSNPCNIATYDLTIASAANCWIKGVRALWAARALINLAWESHSTLQDSYLYGSILHLSGSYGVETQQADDNLIVNNIIQQLTDSAPTLNAVGTVVSYNFSIDSTYGQPGGQWFQASFYLHAGSDSYNLWEGNVGSGFNADAVHGTHHFHTFFRNYLSGWQRSCGNPQALPCIQQTLPVNVNSGSRYFSFIGNVLGTPNYHNSYQCLALSTAPCNTVVTSIYAVGYTGEVAGSASGLGLSFCTTPACTATGNYDPETVNYMMRWGNYDVVNGATQWNSSEVPSSISSYANPVPSSHTLPASFYLSTQPSWWGSLPWPGIGPDVSNGNIGQCSGGTYARVAAISSSQCTPGGGSRVAALSGTANVNPAMNCAYNVMNMPVDGSGSALSFNAASCYDGAPSPPPPPPSGTAPPTSFSLIVH
jgi:hypothetical protein